MARGDYDDMVTDDGNRRLRRGNRRTVLLTLFFIIVALIVLVIYLIANPTESVTVSPESRTTENKDDSSAVVEKKTTLFDFSLPSSFENDAVQDSPVAVSDQSALDKDEQPDLSEVEVPSENAVTRESTASTSFTTDSSNISAVHDAEAAPGREDGDGSRSLTQDSVEISVPMEEKDAETVSVNTEDEISDAAVLEENPAISGSVVSAVKAVVSSSDDVISSLSQEISSAVEETSSEDATVISASDSISGFLGSARSAGRDIVTAIDEAVSSAVKSSTASDGTVGTEVYSLEAVPAFENETVSTGEAPSSDIMLLSEDPIASSSYDILSTEENENYPPRFYLETATLVAVDAETYSEETVAYSDDIQSDEEDVTDSTDSPDVTAESIPAGENTESDSDISADIPSKEEEVTDSSDMTVGDIPADENTESDSDISADIPSEEEEVTDSFVLTADSITAETYVETYFDETVSSSDDNASDTSADASSFELNTAVESEPSQVDILYVAVTESYCDDFSVNAEEYSDSDVVNSRADDSLISVPEVHTADMMTVEAETSDDAVYDDEVVAGSPSAESFIYADDEDVTVSYPEADVSEEVPPESAAPVLLIDSESVVKDSNSAVVGDSLVISGRNGSAVKSVSNGTVVDAGRENGRKYVVVLDSEGNAIKYSGFERVMVKVKTRVKEGTVLGSIGSSSDSSVTVSSVDVE